MASYKYSSYVVQNDDAAFDVIHQPGVSAPFAGIYKCAHCGHEIGIASGHTLPPENHTNHPPGKPIQWRLAVFAIHNR